MNRQEYTFIELCRQWGSTPVRKQDHIVRYVRHKRNAGFGLFFSWFVALYQILHKFII